MTTNRSRTGRSEEPGSASIGTASPAGHAISSVSELASSTAGLSDLTLRDVGVLGLALSLTGDTRQRLALAS
jgi:hypothetical protein